jgi:hypothetical protein
VGPSFPPDHETSALPGRRGALAFAAAVAVLIVLALAAVSRWDSPVAPPTAAAPDRARTARASPPPTRPVAGPAEGTSAEEGASVTKTPAVQRTSTPARPSRGRSRAIGLPFAGRLQGGVRLRPEGATFFSWDPVVHVTPNRLDRRYGTKALIRGIEGVLANYTVANPGAPRVGIGDLSRPRGGPFGSDFGGLGHGSHQNGLDVDIYYPRRDGQERPPDSPDQIDRRLAQDLVNRWVRAGAQFVFVGPNTGLGGRRGVVQQLVLHDEHMHVRIFPPRR